MLNPPDERDQNNGNDPQRDNEQHDSPFLVVHAGIQKDDRNQAENEGSDERGKCILGSRIFHQQLGGSGCHA